MKFINVICHWLICFLNFSYFTFFSIIHSTTLMTRFVFFTSLLAATLLTSTASAAAAAVDIFVAPFNWSYHFSMSFALKLFSLTKKNWKYECLFSCFNICVHTHTNFSRTPIQCFITLPNDTYLYLVYGNAHVTLWPLSYTRYVSYFIVIINTDTHVLQTRSTFTNSSMCVFVRVCLLLSQSIQRSNLTNYFYYL